jgi:hypothetical protein
MPIWLILIFRCVYKVVLSRVLARVFSSLPPWPRSSFYTTKGYHNGQLEYAFLPNTGHVPEEQNDGWTPNGHRPLLSERYAVLLPPFWLGSSTDSLPPSRGSILSPREDPLPQPVALSFPKWPRHSLLPSGSDGALYMNRVPVGIGTNIPVAETRRETAFQHTSPMTHPSRVFSFRGCFYPSGSRALLGAWGHASQVWDTPVLPNPTHLIILIILSSFGSNQVVIILQ